MRAAGQVGADARERDRAVAQRGRTRALTRGLADTATMRRPLIASTAVRRSVIWQPENAFGEHVTGTSSFPFAKRAAPHERLTGRRRHASLGIVTNALFAVTLPPASAAVTWHCRWWPDSWPLTV